MTPHYRTKFFNLQWREGLTIERDERWEDDIFVRVDGVRYYVNYVIAGNKQYEVLAHFFREDEYRLYRYTEKHGSESKSVGIVDIEAVAVPAKLLVPCCEIIKEVFLYINDECEVYLDKQQVNFCPFCGSPVTFTDEGL